MERRARERSRLAKCVSEKNLEGGKGLSEQNIVKCFFWPGEEFALASSAAAAKHIDVCGGRMGEGVRYNHRIGERIKNYRFGAQNMGHCYQKGYPVGALTIFLSTIQTAT